MSKMLHCTLVTVVSKTEGPLTDNGSTERFLDDNFGCCELAWLPLPETHPPTMCMWCIPEKASIARETDLDETPILLRASREVT
jgi:hypothetical protein